MGSNKYGYKSPNVGCNYSYLTYINPLIATHEPPSRVKGSRVWGYGFGEGFQPVVEGFLVSGRWLAFPT